MTLGAQGVVVDDRGRVLLVRHGYRPGWHFPGGGVEWKETIEEALARELMEEAGVVVQPPASLHGVFANFSASRGDHVALYVVRQWTQASAPSRNFEIVEQGFFAIDALPEGAVGAVRRRVAEIFGGESVSPLW